MSSSNNEIQNNETELKKRTIGTNQVNNDATNVITSEKDLSKGHQKKRKHMSRLETPKWQIVLSVLTKLCLLLVGMSWLGQMILKLSSGNSVNYSFVPMEMEGRISEVEAFLKKTMKMLQVQVDVIDKKIESEVGVVKKELSKKVEERTVLLENEFNKLEAKTNDLGRLFSEFKETSVLTKEEFESFKSELKNRRGGDDISLDQIRSMAKEIVEKELEKHAADGIGRVDHALASGGGRVVKHSEPFVSKKVNDWFVIGKDQSGVSSNAVKMLEPSFGEPGQCFALKGSSGFVEIRLRRKVFIEAVTLEHVSKSVAYDRSSAPKDCMVSAWFEGADETSESQILTEFSYDLEKSNTQTFNIKADDAPAANIVRFEFTSNHGNPSHTCIYRFRVHGHEP